LRCGYLEDPSRPAEPSHTTIDNDHGRVETRTGEVSTDIGSLQKRHDWPGLAVIGKMVRMRETRTKTTTEVTYYVLSTPLSAVRFTELALFGKGHMR